MKTKKLLLVVVGLVLLAVVIVSLFQPKANVQDSLRPALPTGSPSDSFFGQLGFFLRRSSRITTTPQIITPVPIEPTSAEVYKKVQQVVARAAPMGRPNDGVIFQNASLEIVSFKQGKEFVISILGSPFATVREQAEEKFLEVLGLTREEACQLEVSLRTPRFANPDYAWQSYPLSFCPQG